MDSNDRCIRVEEEGVPYLGPIEAVKDIENARQAIHSDGCVEADVVQRYSGQIRIEKNLP
jgi:hypothetical protein